MLKAAQSGDINLLQKILENQSTDHTYEVDEKGYGPAHWTVYFDDAECLIALLRHFPLCLNDQSKSGMTPLHLACLNNSLRSLRIILKQSNLSTLLELKNKWGESPLHLAASTGNVAITKLLLESGANIDSQDNWQRTPIDMALEHGEVNVMNYYKENHPIQFLKASNKSTISSSSCSMGENKSSKDINKDMKSSLKSLQQELLSSTLYQSRINKNKDINLPPKDLTPSSSLSSNNCSQVLNNTNDTITSTSTDICTSSTTLTTDTDCTSTIIKSNNNTSLSPFSSSISTSHVISKKSLSKLIEYPGDPLQLQQLLQDPSVDPLGKDMYGWTALHKFASWDKVDLLDIVLSHLMSSSSTTTAVTTTSSSSSSSSSSTMNNDISQTQSTCMVDIMNMLGGPDKNTILHAAIEMHALKAIEYILTPTSTTTYTYTYGKCDLTIKNKHGLTPLELAQKVNNPPHIIQLLSDYNPKLSAREKE